MKQSIADNTKVTFNFKDIGWEEFYDCGMDFLTEEKAKEMQGAICTIECLETATCLGDKDFEYYDITFEDGTEIPGCSGYHLEPMDYMDYLQYKLNELLPETIRAYTPTEFNKLMLDIFAEEEDWGEGDYLLICNSFAYANDDSVEGPLSTAFTIDALDKQGNTSIVSIIPPGPIFKGSIEQVVKALIEHKY